MPYEGKLDDGGTLHDDAPQGFSTLLDIIARLRAPDGCPWDREQTHVSLKPNLLEECYEALEAIDEADDRKLCEELGDILMQVALHSQMGREDGQFSMGDVLRSINTKLITTSSACVRQTPR